jgi:hypothetical protein
MRRLLPSWLILCSLLLTPSLFAATADLRITTMTISGDPTMTGERFAVTMRWRNDGPDSAHFLLLTVTGNPVPFYVLSVATSGWPCYPNADGTSFSCQNAQLVPGAEAELVLQMLTPPAPGPFALRAEIHSAETDPQPANNVAQLSMNIAAAPAADLAISPFSQLYQTTAGAQVTIPLTVSNSGPNEVRNLTAVITQPVSSAPLPFSADGEGWSCGHPAYGPQAIVCTRNHLAAGEVAPITVTGTAPPSDGTLTFNARVRGEGHSDPLTANDASTATIKVGTGVPAESWNRVFIPLTGGDVPGSGGALWRTETTVLIDSDTQLQLTPIICTRPVCDDFPLHRPFVTTSGLHGGSTSGEFVYVHPEDESKLFLNSRVYDVNRLGETAGSEIPVVRGEDFRSTPISLLGIPVSPRYHHTLRVYDYDSIDGAQVTIRIYADEETVPRLSTTRALTNGVGLAGQPGGGLPSHPASLQLEIGQLLSLSGIRTLRVDVEPVDAATRLWSFVSVTNSDTHHVTTFSAN